jgi:hypothetical protein
MIQFVFFYTCDRTHSGDDNLSMGIEYPSDTRPDRHEYGHIFLPADMTHTQSESSQVRTWIFFSAHG